MFHYQNIWIEVKSQLFDRLSAEPLLQEGKYIYGKLKTWKKRIKTNFQGEEVPYDVYCNARAVLRIDFLYKHCKNCYPQVYVEEGECTAAKS